MHIMQNNFQNGSAFFKVLDFMELIKQYLHQGLIMNEIIQMCAFNRIILYENR